MNLIESVDHPKHYDEHKFSPFQSLAPFEVSDTYYSYENILDSCKYYCLPSPDTYTLHHHPKNCEFSIIHVNVRSLLSDEKFDEFETFLYRTHCRWSVICVSESWLCDGVEQRKQLVGYTGYFDNRKNGTGGGVAVYVRNDMIRKSKQLPSAIRSTESLLIECHLLNNCSFIICQVYKPPNLNFNNFLEELKVVLDNVETMKKTVFVSGDFNLNLLNTRHCGATLEFFNILASSSFLPLISKPTRVQNESYSVIDNIFCNNLSLIDNNGIILDDSSDHFPIFATIKFEVQIKKSEREVQSIFDYDKLPQLTDHLVQTLAEFENINDPEVACEQLISAYTSGINKFSFHRRPTRKNCPIKPWITPAILASIDNRYRLFKMKQSNPSEENKKNYNQHRNILNTVLKIAKQKYIQSQLEANKDDAKRMWETLITHTVGRAPRNKYPNFIQTDDNKHVENEVDIAEHFNGFFSSVGEKLQQNIKHGPNNGFSPVGDTGLTTTNNIVQTNRSELSDIIKNMKNVGSGLDKINAKIFKKTYYSILDKLVHFINVCLMHGKFPSRLKIAVVKPIYKSGDRACLTNYRPISILPYVSKILERVIHTRLSEYFENNNILCPNQFGFRKGHSTYMPLLVLQDRVLRGFESQKISCGIFLDLKKAFDTVDHAILMQKLQAYGVNGTFWSIINSYLSNRYQCVEFKNALSNLREIKIGIPQGSILGPLLFIIFINDFAKISDKFTPLLFADDTALLFEADSPQQLQKLLDEELPKVCSWLQANKLSLNTQKTYCQVYSNFKKNISINVTLAGEKINEVETVKYLGVFIDKNMKWNSHITHISKIISRNIGIINHSKYFLSNKHRYLLYNSLILPYLTYCSLLWGNAQKTLLDKLIVLQKK